MSLLQEAQLLLHKHRTVKAISLRATRLPCDMMSARGTCPPKPKGYRSDTQEGGEKSVDGLTKTLFAHARKDHNTEGGQSTVERVVFINRLRGRQKMR